MPAAKKRNPELSSHWAAVVWIESGAFAVIKATSNHGEAKRAAEKHPGAELLFRAPLPRPEDFA
jgi:hypothetical protein